MECYCLVTEGSRDIFLIPLTSYHPTDALFLFLLNYTVNSYMESLTSLTFLLPSFYYIFLGKKDPKKDQNRF